MQSGVAWSRRAAGTGARRTFIAVIAALVVVALAFVVIPIAHAVLVGAFMYHDARGIPVEPAWTGFVARYGGVAMISLIIGYGLGRLWGFRLVHGVATGVLAALALVLFWYGRLALGGSELTAGAALTAFFSVVLGTAPVLGVSAAAGARMYERPG